MIAWVTLYSNALRTLFWIVMTPVAHFAGWLESVTFVSLISIWALVETSWGAHQGRMAKEEAKN